MKLQDDKISEIIKNLQLDTFLDENGIPQINYSQFLAATISINNLTDEMFWALFKHFDTDNSNFITRDDIIEAMSKCGRGVTKGDLDEIFKNHDPTHDDKISFEEFKGMFQQENIELSRFI